MRRVPLPFDPIQDIEEWVPEWKAEFTNDLSQIWILEKVLASKATFNALYDKFYYYLLDAFEYKNIREAKVTFKFKESDEDLYELQLRHFISNMIMWRAWIKLNDVKYLCEEKMIFHFNMCNTDMITDWINMYIIIPYKTKVSNKRMNIICHDIIHGMNIIGRDFDTLMGISLDIISFAKLYQENNEFRNIVNFKADETKQPHELEKDFDDLANRIIDVLRNNKNSFQPVLRSSNSLKGRQLREFFGIMGLKPNLYDETIPKVIESNIISGIVKPSGQYLGNQGALKSLIMNKNEMGKAGDFSTAVNLLCQDVRLRQDRKWCNTTKYVTYHIRNKKMLSFLRGRFYLDELEWKCINPLKDTHLIGQHVILRSPITCSSEDGHVCLGCYGELWYTDRHLNSPGTKSGVIVTNKWGLPNLGSFTQ